MSPTVLSLSYTLLPLPLFFTLFNLQLMSLTVLSLCCAPPPMHSYLPSEYDRLRLLSKFEKLKDKLAQVSLTYIFMYANGSGSSSQIPELCSISLATQLSSQLTCCYFALLSPSIYCDEASSRRLTVDSAAWEQGPVRIQTHNDICACSSCAKRPRESSLRLCGQ